MSATKTVSPSRRFMRQELGDKRAWLAAASDEELVQLAYDLVVEVDNEDVDDDLPNALYCTLGEVFDRFAPEAEWRAMSTT